MTQSGNFETYNLGNGNGYSVREVLAASEKAVGSEISFEVGPRREGDPAILVAASQKARDELGWTPAHDSIEAITESAWHWECYRRDTLT